MLLLEMSCRPPSFKALLLLCTVSSLITFFVSFFSLQKLVQLMICIVPDTASFTSEDECKWYWHQMIYFPETINTISTTNTMSPTHSLVSSWAMHVNLLCACWHLEAMKGSSSLTSSRLLILSRLSSSLIWAQLTLLVPAWGTRSPSLQNGAPIHSVRAHSLTGIRNMYYASAQRTYINQKGKQEQGKKKKEIF